MSSDYKKLILIDILVMTLALQPSDITRFEGETDVFIPCPYEFQPTPSIWRINGTAYTSATLPSQYSLNPGGLLIKTVHRCLDQTSFQCIDTSGSSLAGQKSSIGILTVVSREKCTANELEFFLSTGPESIELDHQQILYNKNETTIAWRDEVNCSISRVLSHLPCQQNELNVNITTNESRVIIASRVLQEAAGELLDVTISHLSEGCSRVSDIIRFNITETEIISLVLGDNNCTCVQIECQGSLNVAISNPASSTPDILCPIFADDCYSPTDCNGFDGMSFFQICDDQSENLMDRCTYSMCFGNVSELLNGTRLDFFVLNKTRCDSTLVYYPREYFKSLEVRVERALARISVNTSSNEVCLITSLPVDCEVVQLTQHNVTVTDITGNLIFKDEHIPENDCITLDDLSPQCGPFSVSSQPHNDHIIYEQVTKEIWSDTPVDMCSCLKNNIDVEIEVRTPNDTSLTFGIVCSTLYLSKLYLMIAVATSNTTIHTERITCPGQGEVSMSLDFNGDLCSAIVTACGYWVQLNGSTLLDCPLNCTSSVTRECATNPTRSSPKGATIAAILVFVVMGVLLIVGITIVSIVYKRRLRSKAEHSQVDLDEHDLKASKSFKEDCTRSTVSLVEIS